MPSQVVQEDLLVALPRRVDVLVHLHLEQVVGRAALVASPQQVQQDVEASVVDADLGHAAADAELALLAGKQGDGGDRRRVEPSLHGLVPSLNVGAQRCFAVHFGASPDLVCRGALPSAPGPREGCFAFSSPQRVRPRRGRAGEACARSPSASSMRSTSFHFAMRSRARERADLELAGAPADREVRRSTTSSVSPERAETIAPQPAACAGVERGLRLGDRAGLVRLDQHRVAGAGGRRLATRAALVDEEVVADDLHARRRRRA